MVLLKEPKGKRRTVMTIKNVVLVHGAFADGSGWEAVANILKKDGYTVSVVQHPETSYAEDIKFTKAVIDLQSGPVVLVGPQLWWSSRLQLRSSASVRVARSAEAPRVDCCPR
jgi:hypothetical protein